MMMQDGDADSLPNHYLAQKTIPQLIKLQDYLIKARLPIMPRPPDLPRDEQVLKKETGPCGMIEIRRSSPLYVETNLKIAT